MNYGLFIMNYSKGCQEFSKLQNDFDVYIIEKNLMSLCENVLLWVCLQMSFLYQNF